MTVGETREVEAVPNLSAYTASGSFSKSGTCIAITANGSYYCKIKANYVGTGTLSYWGAVARSNTWTTETYDYYWDVEVKAKPGDNTGGGTSVTTKYTGDVPTDDWQKSGNYSISWYNKNAKEYTLSTNKELAGMAYLINNGYTEFEGKTIKLTNNIDLSGKKWVQCKSFKGTFDGQGHIVAGIYMGNDDTDQINYGFWKTMTNASISNITMKGVANFAYTKKSAEDTAAGGITGYAKNSSFERCVMDIDMYFSRGECTAWGWTASEESDLGGLVGEADKSTFRYCSYFGNINCSLPAAFGPQGVFIGGIFGNSYGGTVEYCETLSSSFLVTDYGQSSMWRSIFGIGYNIGGYNYGNVKCCRSIIDNIIVENTNSPSVNVNEVVYFIGGIARLYDHIFVNSYAVISNLKINSKQPLTEIYYGALGYSNSTLSPAGCFSNNDVIIDSNKNIGKINNRYTCYDGTTSFSKEQMQSSAFLEELNMYPTLEMDGPIWTQDSNGGYPYIAELYKTTDVKAPKVKDADSVQSIYSLSGQRLDKPRKGINIIGGKKVVVK